MMFQAMLNRFQTAALESRLNETRAFRLEGIKFKIKRIDALNYLDGSKAMIQVYDTYQIGKEKNRDASLKQVREHMRDVILAGTVHPILSRKKDDDGLFVDNLFTDPVLANGLYEAIMAFTYGKKKL